MERVATVIGLVPLRLQQLAANGSTYQRSAFSAFSASGQGSRRLPDFIQSSVLKASPSVSRPTVS